MFCARCDQPFKPGEPRKSYDHPSASGPGITVIVHTYLCKKPPTQTAPSGLGR